MEVIKKIWVASFVFIFLLNIKVCGGENLTGWNSWQIIQPSKKSETKTAVLIIAPLDLESRGNDYVHERWRLGKRTWLKYMNSNESVDCYFLECTKKASPNGSSAWIEGNTIYVNHPYVEKVGSDMILYKSVAAINLLLSEGYSHFVRTNVNTFMDLDNLKNYSQNHNNSFFTAFVWENAWYSIGYGVYFTSDVAKHIVDEYSRLEKTHWDIVSPHRADDAVLTSLATGVYPYQKNHPFKRYGKLPIASRQIMTKRSLSQSKMANTTYATHIYENEVTYTKAWRLIEQAPPSTILYRIRDKLTLSQLETIYEYLIKKHYKNY